MAISPNNVYVVQTNTPEYGRSNDSVPAELSSDTQITTSLMLLRRLFRDAGLDLAHYGSAKWNPLGDLIKAGAKVVLKPNWVLDRNRLPGGLMECLVTHTTVIEAVLHYVVKTQPKSIIVGDASLQSCDFENLRNNCGLDEMRARFQRLGHEIQICDFRLTKMTGRYTDKARGNRNDSEYTLFDLGDDSWLNPVTAENTEFRVTDYNPDIIKKHHYPGTHRYLIAREIMDADVVISLPKLKTHKKAGITGALKNMVGINGFKEYLPHHRKGGSQTGGDCYEGGSRLKKFAEDSLDRANRGRGRFSRYLHTKLGGLAMRLEYVMSGNYRNLEGSWYGNDTVWRMCLDLQRILHYGKYDGTIENSLQRKVITITDAIIAGDGEGPLSPSPVGLGVMTLGLNVAALEWVHSFLMHFDPEKIPLLDNAFAPNRWPLADFSPADIKLYINGELLSNVKSAAQFGRHFMPPTGWRGHCDYEDDLGTNNTAVLVKSDELRNEEDA